MQNDPSIPPHFALVANIKTMRQVLAAIVSRLPPHEAALTDLMPEQGVCTLSSTKAAATDLSDDHLRAHINAREDFRRIVRSYKTMPPKP